MTAMTDSFGVELRDVTKRFGEVTAVDDLELQIRDGEFFSLIGPRGCGKTTTLRIIAGALLAFTLSLDDFVITFFVSGPGSTTLPVRVYSMIKFGVTPEVNAISTLMLLGSTLLVVLSLLLQRKA